MLRQTGDRYGGGLDFYPNRAEQRLEDCSSILLNGSNANLIEIVASICCTQKVVDSPKGDLGARQASITYLGAY